jgi:hypothetical protein
MLYQKHNEFGLKEGELVKAISSSARASREVILVVGGRHHLLHSIEADENGVYLYSDIIIPKQKDLFEGRNS